ncbi:MAG: hypothetical protein K6E92_07180, partial [Lachnospiraceae bacterium]|nr:hypothetical protein [Lachnospiraceae bacterium]
LLAVRVIASVRILPELFLFILQIGFGLVDGIQRLRKEGFVYFLRKALVIVPDVFFSVHKWPVGRRTFSLDAVIDDEELIRKCI